MTSKLSSVCPANSRLRRPCSVMNVTVLTISTYRSWQGIDYETRDTTVAWNMLSKPFSSILACFNLLRSKYVTVNFATNCDSNSRPSRSYTSPTKGCVHECQMSPRVATNGKKKLYVCAIDIFALALVRPVLSV